MLKLKKIAVTGGLAAGKTTVCQIFKELGAYVVSADEIVHQLLSPSTPVGQQVIHLLGPDILQNNKLDREKIAEKVFSQPNLLKALEKITHPAVFDAIEQKYQQLSFEKKFSLFIAEVPLLYESGAEGEFDGVVTVVASPTLCKARFITQSSYSADEFEKRMKRQIEPKVKAEKANYTIENNGNFETLKISVKTLYNELTRE
jgi:dephospho-CoA kinase